MIPRIHAGGRGVRGLVAYITHDASSPGERQPTTNERVGFVTGLNLPTDDPHLAGLIMRRTAADAEDLKELAGTSSRGRKLKAPFSHLSLSWSPNEPRPDRAEMLRATEEALKSIGMDACQALVVEHTETAHPHVHVAVCRVDPETGKACGRKNDARKLSTWAEKYERSRGRIQVPNRIARREARETCRAVVDVQVDNRVTVDEAKTKARAVVPLPPMQKKRGAGRAARTPAERQEWAVLFKAQAQSRTPPDQARRERVRLARPHRQRRRRQKVLAPLTKLWRRAPGTTPGRTEPAAKPTAPRISGPDLQRLETQISARRGRISDKLYDTEAAVRKAERGAPRRQRESASFSTTHERKARETFEAAVRDDRDAQRTLRAAVRKHAAARDTLALAAITPAASGWTPRRVSMKESLAEIDAEERCDQASNAEFLAEVQAGSQARKRQQARADWRDAAADKLQDRQERRQKAREHRPARRRLQRLRQRVAGLRRRLTTLDAALKAVERVFKQLGLSKPSPTPAPQRPTPAPAPARTRNTTFTPPPPTPRTAPTPEPTARKRASLVEVLLLEAVRDGGPRLARARADFERMDAGAKLKHLVRQAVDPELLEAAVGPKLAPVWVKPLRERYAAYKRAHPADWTDIEKNWQEQRNRWRPSQESTPRKRSAPKDPNWKDTLEKRGISDTSVDPPKPPPSAVDAAAAAQKPDRRPRGR